MSSSVFWNLLEKSIFQAKAFRKNKLKLLKLKGINLVTTNYNMIVILKSRGKKLQISQNFP
jgi:hypothetical protein